MLALRGQACLQTTYTYQKLLLQQVKHLEKIIFFVFHEQNYIIKSTCTVYSSARPSRLRPADRKPLEVDELG
jgi:hypothetical protein